MSGARPAHLLRREAIYAVRFRLPTDLVRPLGVTELRRSLHTADPKEARHRCLRATVWFRVTVELLRAMTMPTRSDLEAAAKTFFDEASLEIEAREPLDPGWDERGFNIEESSERLRALEDQLGDDSFDGKVKHTAQQLMVRAGSAPPVTPTLEAQQLAARVEREQMRLLLHRLTHSWRDYQPDDALLAGGPSPEPNAVPAPRPRFTDLSVAEAIYRHVTRKRIAGVGSSQLDEVGRALSWLEEHLGSATLLSTVTKDQMREFRDGVERIDSRLQGRGGFAFNQRQTPNEAHWNNSVTSIRHWRAAQGLFSWATAEGFLEHDISVGLKIARRKDDLNRTPEPFSADELKKLFASPLFAGHKSPKQLLAPGLCRERGGFWWSGLLALYTGMRAGEIAQLLTVDFDFKSDVPVIHVRRDDGAGEKSKKVKTDSSVRDVPIAEPLLVLGLAAFVGGRHKRFKGGRLLPEIRLGQKDRTSDGMSKFWGRTLRVAKVHKAGRSVHVFRHTVAAAMRAASVPEEVIGAVLGHTPTSITGQYGGRFPAARLAKAIASIDYGFDVIGSLGGPYQSGIHKA